jgi:aspartyl-tRNA(Asn)/glutamyl-tRNA(Gln) amidotransferase subunit A
MLTTAQQAVTDPDFAAEAELGSRLSNLDVQRLVLRRGELGSHMRQFMERFDLILTPTAPVPPFPVEMRSGPETINGVRMTNYIQWALLTYAFTVVNAPAISVPCGFTRAGLPVGLQLAGRWRDEAGVLRAAAAFEAAAPWAHRRPPERSTR